MATEDEILDRLVQLGAANTRLARQEEAAMRRKTRTEQENFARAERRKNRFKGAIQGVAGAGMMAAAPFTGPMAPMLMGAGGGMLGGGLNSFMGGGMEYLPGVGAQLGTAAGMSGMASGDSLGSKQFNFTDASGNQFSPDQLNRAQRMGLDPTTNLPVTATSRSQRAQQRGQALGSFDLPPKGLA